MHTRGLLIGAILSNVVLGNLCMMPMAMAEEMPDMPGMSHDMPMDHESDDKDNRGMSCAGEHCFAHALPTQISLNTDAVPVAAAPTTNSIIDVPFVNKPPRATSTAPPGQFIHVKTIVLRY